MIVVMLMVIAVALGIPAYHGYRPRALIDEAIIDAMPLQTSVAEFYESHRRLPLDAEARALQRPPSELKRAQSVVWDPTGSTIVVTVSEPQSQSGKHFAIHAEERNGTLTWSCRTIDLDPKYLPGSCR